MATNLRQKDRKLPLASGFVRISGILTTLVGILVLIGWATGNMFLKAITPSFPTMKTTTAFCFILTGIMLLCFDGLFRKRTWLNEFGIPTLATIVLFVMGLQLLAILFGWDMGVERLFFPDEQSTSISPFPGRAALPTAINFLLIGGIGMMVQWDTGKRLRRALRSGGIAVAGVGAIGIIGFLMDKPIWYYAVEKMYNAIALNTAILFVFVGISFILLGKEEGYSA